MSTTVDDRVVEMRFDNSNFEQNVGQTLGTLDKLSQALNLPGATKGLQDVSAAAARCDLSPLGSAVETVSAKFSALDAIAFTVLQNITNSVMHTGKKIVDTFAIQPITTGFNEYELKMGSVQTIMASTGESLETVNKYLEELNKYADQTIYSFSDMTNNIGKFTNAGVKLEDAVAAIKGISNEAALAGANSQQASHAMYNFAQALSAGFVQRIDWKSIENANMATKEFKEQLLETAVECKTVEKTSDGMYKVLTKNLQGKTMEESMDATHYFNESLQQQWMTTEVLTKTLAKYSDANEDIGKRAYAAAQDIKTFSMMMDTLKEAAQSGWAQSWELIFGDFEEAKSLWTEIGTTLGDVLQKSADSRNGLLKSWKELGGRQAIIESLRNSFNGIVSILKPISEAFNEIIPPLTGQHLADLSKKIEEITKKFTLSETASEELKTTFKGLFSVVDIIRRAFLSLTQTASPVAKLLGRIAGYALHGASVLSGYLIQLDKFVVDTDIFNKAVSKSMELLKQFLEYSKSKLSDLGLPDFSLMLDKVKEHISTIIDSITDFKKHLSNLVDALSHTKSGANFFDGLFKVFGGLTKLGSGAVNAVSAIFDAFNKITGSASFNTILDFVNNLIGIGVGIAFAKLIGGFADLLDVFEGFQLRLKAGALKEIGMAIAILAGAMFVISMIDSERLGQATFAISTLMIEMAGLMKFMSGLSIGKGVRNQMGGLIAFAASILILASAMKKLSDIDPERLADSMVAVSALIWEMVGVVTVIGGTGKKIMKGAGQLIIFALALEIIADVCRRLSALSWEELERGLSAVGILLAELAGFLNLAKFGKMSISTSVGLVLVAAALKILYGVAKDFSTMKPEEMERGFTAIGLMLTELAAFLLATSNSKHVLSTAVSMTILAAALKILYSAFADYASMDYDSIGRGLTAMGLALTIIVAAVRTLPKPAQMISSSVGLVLIGAAMKILASAFRDLAFIDSASIGNGLLAMGGILGEVAIAMLLMRNAVPGAIALTIVAGAFALLVPELKSLGDMSVGSIIKSLVMLGATLAIIGAAGMLLGPAVPVIIGLAVAIGLLSIAIMAMGGGLTLIGVGLSAIAIGITTVAASLAAGGAAIVASISAIILEIVGLLPAIAVKIVEGITAFAQAIANAAPVIFDAVKTIVLGLVDVIVECLPEIVGGALEMILALLDALTEYAPQIVSKLADLIVGLFDSLAEKIPDLVHSFMNFAGKLFKAIIDELSSIDYDQLIGSLKAIGIITALAFAFAALVPVLPGAIAGVVGIGVVIGELSLVLAAIGALSKIPGLQWLIDESADFLGSIGNAIGSFVGGIVGGIAKGATSALPEIATNLSDFMTNLAPFITGMNDIDSTALSSVETLTGVILKLTAADILSGITKFVTGSKSMSSFGEGLVSFGQAFADYATTMAGIDNFDAVTASAAAAESLSTLTKGLGNSGGFISLVTGDNTLTKFGKQIADFGPQFAEYAESVADVDPDVVTKTAAAASSLASMARVIPDTSGVFNGKTSLADFGKELAKFGPDYATFASSVAEVDSAQVQNAITGAIAVTTFASSIPENIMLDEFGIELRNFGVNYKVFCDGISEVKPESISAITLNIKQLAGIATELATVDVSSFNEFATAVNTLGDLGGKDFSTGITTAAENVKKAVSEMMSGLINTVNTYSPLVTSAFSNMLTSVTSIMSQKQTAFKSGGTTLMSNFLAGFKTNQSQATSSIVSTLSTTINRVNSYSSKFNTAGSNISKSLVTGISNNAKKISTAITSKVSSALASVRGYASRFYSAGQSLAISLKNGASSVSISGGFTSAISSALFAINDRKSDFYEAGGNLVKGFANGIDDYAYIARNAAKDLGESTVDALKRAAKERSPSKLTYSIGFFFDKGFANAISDYSYLAEDASDKLGNKSVETLSDTLSEIGSMLDSGIDVEPTIRPVLDLSNVQSGIGQLNGMINADRSMSLGYSGIITGRLSDVTAEISQQEQTNILRRMSNLMDTYFPQFNENDVYLDTGAIAGAVNRKLGLQT